MNPDLNHWDPMLEEFVSGQKYEAGPGADLHFTRNQKKQETTVFLTNLPAGITEEGILNLCLSGGAPTSVSINNSGAFAFVTFKSFKEAELAIQDLNKTPPYFLKATFSRGQGDGKSSKASNAKETDEGWFADSFETISVTNKDDLIKKVPEKNCPKVWPYFFVNSEYDDPSLVMRQRNLDFKTAKECVSMGRGYLNIGDVYRYSCDNRIFSCKSDVWNENDCETKNCNNCGSMTFKQYEETDGNYCSKKCETISRSTHVQNRKSSIFDLFSPGICGVLDFRDEIEDHRVNCCVMLDKESDKYERLINFGIFDGDHDNEEISDEKGSRVMVQIREGRFQRGVVCSNEGDFYSVALIDYGEMVSVTELYSFPDDLGELPTLGGVATFLTDNLPNLDLVQFRVKEKKAFGSWLCEIISNNKIVCDVILEEWSVPEGLTYVPLDSGCSVVITSFVDMKTVFVRRIDGNWDEDFIRLCNDVSAYSLEAKKYKKLPKLGEVCSAAYKDGCFYRAVVRFVRRRSVYLTFVDYGNDQETKLDDLRFIPDAVRKVNCFAVRVRLKNVPDKSSLESVKYLNRLTAYGTELRLTWEDGEVILTDETSGDVVNKVVADMMVPIWEKDSSVFINSVEPYTLDSVGELTFHPEETEDIFLLNFNVDEFNDSGVFWATQNRTDYLGHLNGELKQAMTEYCSCLPDHPYRPRTGELCIVELDDEFYRGVSLDDRTSPYKIFLIDFGKSVSVETKNMRKIVKEFLEMPALALECKVSDFDKLDEEKLQKVGEYMMNMSRKCLKNVKITRKINGVYEISIPFVRELLDVVRKK